MTPQEIAALAQIQRRASIEDRAHLVALVEHAWGVPAASAERLVPGGVRIDSTRLDCEKPIRDENGKFLGCEPGGGDGSSGGASASGGSAPKRETAAPHESDSPRVARVKAERSRLRKEVTWSTPEQHDELDHQEVTKAKEVDAAIERGHVVAPKVGDGEGPDGIQKLTRQRDEAADEVGDEIHEHHAKAAKVLSELRDLNSTGGDDDSEDVSGEVLDLGIDEGELDFSGTADLLGSSTRKGAISFDEPGERDPETEVGPKPEEPDLSADEDLDFDDPEAVAAAAKESKEKAAKYKADLKAYKERVATAKAAVIEKAGEAADVLEAAHEEQLAAIAKLKDVQKKTKTSVKKAFKGADSEPEDFVHPDLVKKNAAAEKFFDKNPDAEGADADKHLKAIEEFEAAYDAADALRTEVENAKEDALEDADHQEKIDRLKETAAATKRQAARLRKAIKQKPKVYKKAAVDEDEEDDADEE